MVSTAWVEKMGDVPNQQQSTALLGDADIVNIVADHSTNKQITKAATPSKKPVKKRGRPPKAKKEVESTCDGTPSKQAKITDSLKKSKRTVNRFKGVTKEELMQRFLPDHIKHGLDILIIGINPGLFAVYKGHHYAGPGNHFWNCINMSGMVDKPVNSDNDVDLLKYGIGFSTIVQRTTPSAKDLSSKEIREGGKSLIEKIKTFQPKIAVFNGKGIYEIFSKEVFGQKKKDFLFGVQPNKIPGTDTYIFVMPSSSARCAQFPRAQDKVSFFIQIKKLRDEINGIKRDNDIEEIEYSFDLQKATELVKAGKVKTERHDPSYDENDAFPTQSSTEPATSPALDSVAPVQDQPSCSKGGVSVTPSSPLQKEMNTSKSRKGNAADNHPQLVRFLCQNDVQTPKAGAANKKPFHIPRLHQVVSEEQKNERVGVWVRTQIDQNYESEPPMGYEERLRMEVNAENPESDRGSQVSNVSAGVSGSTSTGSTSGYGSLDTNRNAQFLRQDRVEMWVREQQYVRQQSAASQGQFRRVNLPCPPVVSEPEQHMASTSTRSSPSFEAWNNFAPQPGNFAGAHINLIEGGFRPPVPLYSSWGGRESTRFSGLAPNINNSNNIVGTSQMNINNFLP